MTPARNSALLAAAVAAGFASAASAHILPFFAVMDGPQVVDPTESPATGACSILYNHHAFSIEINLYLEGIGLDDLKGDGPNNTPIHIHSAPYGVNGPLVVDLGWWAVTTLVEYEPKRLYAHWDGVFIGGEQGNVYSDYLESETALYDGNLYIDVHTNAYPDGEIRGQILPVPTPGAIAMFGFAGMVVARRRRAK
ncbi:MAG: CHRD domain-containing protein [Phycisphaerales bacterium]